ncbi:MAG TPA: hypothetical protein VFC84_21100 [Desulfosporosinus sp.]|nr:hypothetical protein [Desulfosporosinus sp.]
MIISDTIKKGGILKMCFRPAAVSKGVECPNCKKKLAAIGGVQQKKCPFCKTEIPPASNAGKADK